MSNDLVRKSQDPGLGSNLPASMDSMWTQQQLPAASSQGSEIQPLQVIHRSLRGRYPLAITLGILGAVLGAAIGYGTQTKKFKAYGSVTVNPQIPSLLGSSEVILLYANYMTSEANRIRSAELAKMAINTPVWEAVAGKDNSGPDDVTAPGVLNFVRRLGASYARDSRDIIITFESTNDKETIAGVNAALEAYAIRRKAEQAKENEDSLEEIQKRESAIEEKIANFRNEIREISRQHDSMNLDATAEGVQSRKVALEKKYDEARDVLERMLDAQRRARDNAKNIPVQQLAARDPLLANLIARKDQIQQELTVLMGVQGSNSPAVIRAQSQVTQLEKSIGQLAERLAADIFGFIPDLNGEGKMIEVNLASIAAQEATTDALDKQIKDLHAKQNGINNSQLRIDVLKDEIKRSENLLTELATRKRVWEGRIVSTAAPFTLNRAAVADLAEDRRPTMATMGFMVGGGLPVLGVLLLGLADRRYRYSDETTGSSITKGIPLLGILPNLPDRLSDPSQASVAAHCVHQIRTMLQLNVLSDQPSILAVTSATSGDGKTSLTLALGLSFAAAGSRTLLIDTDLIGAGLSARLGVNAPEGVGDAIVDSDPGRFVRDTDVADLSILPVGTKTAGQNSAFSPTAVRRLFASLRGQYDIILVDTGPVLGSIEATPLVAAADATILTVARLQDRDLVEKAIAHLRSIGSRIAGVVFNRAGSKDFERSISGISLRSVSRASQTQAANAYNSGNQSATGAGQN
jgi:polysaccharide biosynthesis transport protein